MRKRRKRGRERKIVEAYFADPRHQQENVMRDCLRRALVGDGADLALSSSPIDIIFARRFGDDNGIEFGEQHHAACEWMLRLYRYRSPISVRSALNFGEHSGPGMKPENEHRDAEYLALALDTRLSDKWRSSLVNTVVFRSVPQWLWAILENRESLDNERREFIRACEALRLIWLDYGDKSASQLRAEVRQRRHA